MPTISYNLLYITLHKTTSYFMRTLLGGLTLWTMDIHSRSLCVSVIFDYEFLHFHCHLPVHYSDHFIMGHFKAASLGCLQQWVLWPLQMLQ